MTEKHNSGSEQSPTIKTLRKIAKQLDDSDDSVELTTDDLHALGLLRDVTRRGSEIFRDPTAKGHHDSRPVAYRLYNVDGWWLALKSVSGNSTSHRAIGVGALDVEGVGISESRLRAANQTAVDVSDDLAELIDRHVRDAAEELVEDWLTEVAAAVCDRDTIYVETTDRWVGWSDVRESIRDEIREENLPDGVEPEEDVDVFFDAIASAIQTKIEQRRTRGIGRDLILEYAADYSLDHTPLLLDT